MTNGLVVVLGKCGRNFRRRNERRHAAFVLDDAEDFAIKRCNRASVDLESAHEDSGIAFRPNQPPRRGHP